MPLVPGGSAAARAAMRSAKDGPAGWTRIRPASTSATRSAPGATPAARHNSAGSVTAPVASALIGSEIINPSYRRARANESEVNRRWCRNVELLAHTNPKRKRGNFTGHLFVSVSGEILNVDPTAHTYSVLNFYHPDGLVLSPDGKTLYGAAEGQIAGYDTTTGNLVFQSGAIVGNSTPDGMAVGIGPLAVSIFTNTNDGQVVAVNLSTKVQTVIANGGSRGDFVTLDPNDGSLLLTQADEVLRLTPPSGGFALPTVPEPGSLALMATGLLGLFGFRALRRESTRGVSATP